jgi:hypothetical protein
MQFSYFWGNYQSGVIAEVAEFASYIRTHADELGVPAEVQAGFERYTRFESLLFYSFIYRNAPLARVKLKGKELIVKFCNEDDSQLLDFVERFGKERNFAPDFRIYITNYYMHQRRICRWQDFPGEAR